MVETAGQDLARLNAVRSCCLFESVGELLEFGFAFVKVVFKGVCWAFLRLDVDLWNQENSKKTGERRQPWWTPTVGLKGSPKLLLRGGLHYLHLCKVIE